jgi:SAM-dependent methyltransferase
MATCQIPSLELFDLALTQGRAENKTAARNYWDQKAPAYKKRQDQGGNDDLHERIIQAIHQRVGLDKTRPVLDLGCGPGRHSRLFAQLAGQVTAFDLSPTMIELALSDNRVSNQPTPNHPTASLSSQSNLASPIDYRVLDWDMADLQALGWIGHFYLAFASRTPAIHNLASLQKMIQTVNHGFGALVSSIELYNSLREPLLEKLALPPERIRANRSIYLELNLLWLLGYYPEVSYFDQQWDATRSLEEVIFNQIRYFEMIKELTTSEKDLITKSLSKNSQNGLCREIVTAKTTLVIWEIPPRVTVDRIIRDE